MSEREREHFSDMVTLLSRRMDDAIIKGVIALDNADYPAYIEAYKEAMHHWRLIAQVKDYLRQDLVANRDQLPLH